MEEVIKINIRGASAALEFPEFAGRVNYVLYLKNNKGEFVEYVQSLEATVVLTLLPAGYNEFLLKVYQNDNILYEQEFCIKIDALEVVYQVIQDEVHLFWNCVNYADGYSLYKQSDKHLFTSFKDVTGNNAVLFGIPVDSELKIKPYRLENGKKVYDFPQIKFVVRQSQDVPELLYNWSFALKSDKSSAKMFWKPVKSADRYKIYILKDGEYALLDTVQDNFYSVKYLPVGTSRFYIKAYCGTGCLCQSVVTACEITEIELFGINFDGKVLLYWNKVPYADGYRIFKKNPGGEFGGFLSVNEEKSLIEEVLPDEVCEFKVKPYIMKDGKRDFTGLAAKCKIKVYYNSDISLTVNEAFGSKLAVSWIFDGDVDGFVLYKNNQEFLKINDGLAHIVLVDYSKDNFVIKGYKKLYDEIVFSCSSKEVSVENNKNRMYAAAPESYDVSVIVPAYNSQDYISRSISTVLACNLKNIELIIVDDGSQDGTREIISWYCDKYPAFVKKLFKKNGGVADTRNKGIEYAHGRYIAFMDNDDMIRPAAYSQLFEMIEKTGSDIAVSPLYRIDNDRYLIRHRLPFPENTAIDIEAYLKLIFSDKFNNIGVWNKLYRAELVKSHPFGILMYEDVSWTPYILSWADKFCYVDKICYEWDRKIRSATFSHALSSRTAEEKFKERYEAFRFFYDKGNPKRKECLAYLMAKRLYGQGIKADYDGYFDAIKNMKDELLNNKFLLEDKEYYDKLSPYLT